MIYFLLRIIGVICIAVVVMPACGASLQQLPSGLTQAEMVERGDAGVFKELMQDYLSLADDQWKGQRQSPMAGLWQNALGPQALGENIRGLSQEEQQELVRRHCSNYLLDNSTTLYPDEQVQFLESTPQLFPEPGTLTAMVSLEGLGFISLQQ